MGLSIHYHFHFARCYRDHARELVRFVHRHARSLARTKAIEKVIPIADELRRRDSGSAR